PDAVCRVEADGDDREEHMDELDAEKQRRHDGASLVGQGRATTGIAAPVTPLASSEDRNTTTAAISAALAHRDGSPFGIAARFSGVSMMRGSTAFAVIPSRFVSSASDSVHRTSAAFAMA